MTAKRAFTHSRFITFLVSIHILVAATCGKLQCHTGSHEHAEYNEAFIRRKSGNRTANQGSDLWLSLCATRGSIYLNGCMHPIRGGREIG